MRYHPREGFSGAEDKCLELTNLQNKLAQNSKVSNSKKAATSSIIATKYWGKTTIYLFCSLSST